MIITLGFDNIPLKKLYVSVATFPKPVIIFVSINELEVDVELELLIIYYILYKPNKFQYKLFYNGSFSVEKTICLGTNDLTWNAYFRHTSIIKMIPFTVCVFYKRCIMPSLY